MFYFLLFTCGCLFQRCEGLMRLHTLSWPHRTSLETVRLCNCILWMVLNVIPNTQPLDAWSVCVLGGCVGAGPISREKYCTAQQTARTSARQHSGCFQVVFVSSYRLLESIWSEDLERSPSLPIPVIHIQWKQWFFSLLQNGCKWGLISKLVVLSPISEL